MSNLDNVTIKYIGKGVASIPGVPARDMSNDEAREYDIPALLKSGLYVVDEPEKPKKRKKADTPADDETIKNVWNDLDNIIETPADEDAGKEGE